jgi:hypothetical protein
MDLSFLAWPVVVLILALTVILIARHELRTVVAKLAKFKLGSVEVGTSGSEPAVSGSTPRGISMTDAIRAIGLVDIESRNDKERSLPPDALIENGTAEVFLSGTTLYGFVSSKSNVIQRLLDRGVSVKLLFLDKNSSQFRKISGATAKAEVPRQSLDTELSAALSSIVSRGYHKHPKFSAKKASHLCFSAVLVDGSVEGTSNPHPAARLRVQPYPEFGTPHEGVVMQFRPGAEQNIFQFFRQDLRDQWKNATPAPIQ